MDPSLTSCDIGSRWGDDTELFRVNPMDPSVRWNNDFLIVEARARNSNNPRHQGHKHHAAQILFNQAFGRLAQAQ